MQTGFGALQQAIKDSESRQNRSGGLQYFNWKDGDTKIVRFLTDDVVTADFYEFVIAKDGKSKSFMIDSTKPDYLAKYANGSLGRRKNPKTREIEDAKPRKLGVGLAVLRDERPTESGRTEIIDHIYDQEVDGKQFRSRMFGIIQQSPSNFWHQIVSCFMRYGTICDRDYEITRCGGGVDTKYSIIPCDVDPALSKPEDVARFYGYGVEVDKDSPDRFLMCSQTLKSWTDQFSSEDRYKFWLTPDENTPPELLRGGPAPAAQSSAPAVSTDPWSASHDDTPAPPAGGDEFAALRGRLLGA